MQSKLILAGSAVFLILVILNIGLVNANRDLQAQLNEQSQYLQQSLTLEKIYQPLVRALAELAAIRNDAQIKDLLNEQGINFSLNAPAAPAAPVTPVTP
jgi:type II secretory pathway component PulM